MRPIARSVILCGLLVLANMTAAHALNIYIENNNEALPSFHFVSYSPADGERLDKSPEAVAITFSVAPRSDKSSIRIFDAFGMQLNDGKVLVNGETMSVKITALTPGRYRVRWKARCACDDTNNDLDGSYRFTVR